MRSIRVVGAGEIDTHRPPCYNPLAATKRRKQPTTEEAPMVYIVAVRRRRFGGLLTHLPRLWHRRR